MDTYHDHVIIYVYINVIDDSKMDHVSTVLSNELRK